MGRLYESNRRTKRVPTFFALWKLLCFYVTKFLFFFPSAERKKFFFVPEVVFHLVGPKTSVFLLEFRFPKQLDQTILQKLFVLNSTLAGKVVRNKSKKQKFLTNFGLFSVVDFCPLHVQKLLPNNLTHPKKQLFEQKVISPSK